MPLFATSTRRSRSRRGLTFVETVCAMALLGLVAMTVFGTFSSMMGTQERQQHRLDAMELANRLVLTYLDDDRNLPPSSQPLLFNADKFRWDYHEVGVQLNAARPDVADERSLSVPLSVNRMMAVTVRVWLCEESGGTFEYNETVPSVTLTRLMDPVALRNPDSTNAMTKDKYLVTRLTDRASHVGRNTGMRRNPSTPTPTPAPTPSATSGGKKGS